jgi:hypothetical protein
MRQFIRERKEVGTAQAAKNFVNRRHLPLLGYLLLAGASAYSVGAVRHEATTRRGDLRQAAVQVVRDGCKRDNQTRALLRGILKSSIPTTQQFVREGTLTQAQADRSIEATKVSLKRLHGIDCDKAAERFNALARGD